MIVKNEESNLETALGWALHAKLGASGVAFEQIVVDTGSTDRTVTLAQELGARVCHFKWINDFAAAKNYAIEQATGDWIAFLDADEFLSLEDAEKLLALLQQIESEPDTSKKPDGIIMPWVNVDDSGKPMTIATQVRVFRNKPSIRYVGAIHEELTIDADKYLKADDISIIHTGYAESAHAATGKAERNIKLLREELKKSPKDIGLKAYLANALSISIDEKNQSEAETLFDEVLNSKEQMYDIHRMKAYIFFINKYIKDTKTIEKSENMCRKALKEYPGSIDYLYLLASVLNKKGEYTAAWETLKECESILTDKPERLEESILVSADPTMVFSQMILAAKGLEDIESVILYSTHVLSIDKTRTSILGPCIATLLYYGVSDNEVIELLSNIYDFTDSDDKKLIADAAKACGATGFASIVIARST